MNFKNLIIILLIFSHNTFAKINVVTSTPDIEWAVNMIGGDKIKVESLLNGTEDPHFVDAMPHFALKVARADIVCMIGMELEIGWLPRVLYRSGNAAVQSGGKGHCDLGDFVDGLDKPVGPIDRSNGDVHAAGNPHFHLGPNYFFKASRSILNALIRVDSKNKEYYLNRYKKLGNELQKIKSEVQIILKPIKNKNIMEYHKEFTYFIKEYGFKHKGEVEEIAGVSPSAGRIARISLYAKNEDIYATLGAFTSPKKILMKFKEKSKVDVILLPLSVVKGTKYSNYRDHQVFIAKALRELQK